MAFGWMVLMGDAGRGGLRGLWLREPPARSTVKRSAVLGVSMVVAVTVLGLGEARAGRPSPGAESTVQCRPEAWHRKSAPVHLQPRKSPLVLLPHQAPCPPQESTPSLLDSALPGRALAPYPAYKIRVDLWFLVHDPLTQGPSSWERRGGVANSRGE